MAVDVVKTVNEALIEEFELEAEQLRPEASLIDDLELDSLDAVDLIAALERAFGAKIDEKAARQLRTVGDIHKFCAELVSAA